MDDEKLIKDHILKFYGKLFPESEQWIPLWEDEGIEKITDEDKEWLQRPFSEEEVIKVVKLFKGDKVPGPDGFNMFFFRKCWNIIGKDVWRAVDCIHQEGIFTENINSTSIALIPKKKGAVEVKDFIPISLLGSVYKIIAKLLAERPKGVIGKLISDKQNAFVKGKQIVDAAMIANECLEYLFKRKMKGVAFKLDLEKAYDHVNCSCILSIMKQMNFGDRWIGWIKYCISAISFSVLINGSPQGYFKSYGDLDREIHCLPTYFC